METYKTTIPKLVNFLASSTGYASKNSISIIKFKTFIIIYQRCSKDKQRELYKNLRDQVLEFVNSPILTKLQNNILSNIGIVYNQYLYHINGYIEPAPTHNCQVFSIKSAETIYEYYLFCRGKKQDDLINNEECEKYFSDFMEFMNILYMLNMGTLEAKRMVFLDVKINVMNHPFLENKFTKYTNTRGTSMKYGILNCEKEFGLAKTEEFDITILDENDSAYQTISYEYGRGVLNTKNLENYLKNNKSTKVIKKTEVEEKELPF